MSTLDFRPAPARAPAEAIAEADRVLLAAGVVPYSSVVAMKLAAEQMAALRFGQVYRLTYAASAASLNLQAGTEAGLEEALELCTSAASRGVVYLAQADARPDLRDLPANVAILAAHRVEIVGGRS